MWRCDEAANEMRCDTEMASDLVGYPSSGRRKASGLWCAVDIPPSNWALKSCPTSGSTTVKVLSYNLYWWYLFNRKGGSDRSAGRLIERTSGPEEYDFMGFQECDSLSRVLADSRMTDEYRGIDGGRAIGLAYRHSRWTLLATDKEDVGEDSEDQYYGKRTAMWARFRNAEGKTVFIMNHHGPLRVSQGGGCTGSSTSLNIMRVIGENAHVSDAIILVGDFNARFSSSRIQELIKRLIRVHSGTSMGGVDHIFSNCGQGARGETLGKGDGRYKSDHDAISAIFRI